MIIKWCLYSLQSTVQQTDTGVLCVSVCVRTKLLASGQKTEPGGRDDLYLLTSLPWGRKSCSRRKHHLSSSMVVISLCSVLRALILKPVIHLNTVMDVMIWAEVSHSTDTTGWLHSPAEYYVVQLSHSVCDYHYELELSPYLLFARLCCLCSIFDKREILRRQPLGTETGWAAQSPSHLTTTSTTTYTPDTTKHLLSLSQTMTQFWRDVTTP